MFFSLGHNCTADKVLKSRHHFPNIIADSQQKRLSISTLPKKSFFPEKIKKHSAAVTKLALK